jgi:uncharacterized protein YdhG (YjbR/CyaY superfamily)
MAENKGGRKVTRGSGSGFSDEEKAAMRERARELRARKREEAEDPEGYVLGRIKEMQPSDRALAERLHAIVKANAPSLSPKTWYGMPAYAKGDDIICFFRDAAKFKTRYATLGFSDEAKLDEGNMWPTDYALTKLGPKEEALIATLLKKALG